jgi:hypothetical protein
MLRFAMRVGGHPACSCFVSRPTALALWPAPSLSGAPLLLLCGPLRHRRSPRVAPSPTPPLCPAALWQNHPNYASPRVPVIVLKTSDCCTRKPDNPVVYRVSSGNPESSTLYNPYMINDGVTITLQH